MGWQNVQVFPPAPLGQWVLIKGDAGYSDQRQYVSVAMRMWDGRQDQWLDVDRNRIESNGWGDPTHWRDLDEVLG